MRTIRWGMIGCGAVTEVKSAPAYRQTEGFSLEGVMCRDLQKAKAYAARHEIPLFFDDAAALIEDARIDAVYIATPPDSHARYALMAAEAGKICCIEKPITPDYASALEVVEAFEKRNIPLFVAYYRRSLPRFLEVKRWLDAGRIGRVRQVVWHLTRTPHPRDMESGHWRVNSRVAPAGYFDDVASHGLDLLIFLLGEIVDARGYARNQQGRYSAADAVTACWEHESGVLGSGSWNFGCDRREDRVEIYGERGKITFSVLDEAPIVCENDVEKIERETPHPRHVQYYHVQNMYKALTEGYAHPSTGRSALHTAWVMERMTRG